MRRSSAIDGLTVPPEMDAGHVYHLFPVLAGDRDALQRHLRAHGVETLVHYPVPIPRQPALAAEHPADVSGRRSRLRPGAVAAAVSGARTGDGRAGGRGRGAAAAAGRRRLVLRVLITGGAGFVGSHLADALLQRGDEVFVLDDLSTGSIDNIAQLKAHPRFHYTIDSVSNEPLLAEMIDTCDVVFHLAAAVGVKLIVEAPVHTIETNVHGTEVVLKHANKKKKLVLIASTSEVYGKSTAVPFNEEADLVLGPDAEASLGLRLQQADRRVPGARVLEGTEAPRHHRPASSIRSDRARPDSTGWSSRTSSGRRSPASRSRCSATAHSAAASPMSATSSARWSR